MTLWKILSILCCALAAVFIFHLFDAGLGTMGIIRNVLLTVVFFFLAIYFRRKAR